MTAFVLSVFFCVTCAFGLFLGIYTLYLNPRTAINRAFFSVTISLFFWSFGLSLALTSADIDTCLFWRRFSALGWGSFFSILLHFFLIFTNKTRLLRKWWIYVLLYTPVLVVITAFTYFPGVNPNQYNLVKTEIGWVNIAVNNGWDIFYTIYYSLFSLICFFVVWRWCKLYPDLNVKKQVRLLIISIITAIILGSITDIISNTLLSQSLPQMAPVFMLFPIIIIYSAIKKHGLLSSKQYEEEELLVTDKVKSTVFHYLSMAFMFSGVLSFVITYIISKYARLIPVCISSAILIVIGIIFNAMQRRSISYKTKEILYTIILIAVIPMLTLGYLKLGSSVMWAVSYIFIIISLIISSEFHQISLAIIIILTQIFLWLLVPKTVVVITALDYIIRLLLYIIAICLAFIIKRIYISKNNDNANQIKLQKLISRVSSDYISVNESNIDSKTNDALTDIIEFLEADRAYLYMLSPDGETLTCTHLSIRNDKKHLKCLDEKSLIVEEYSWFLGCITKDGFIKINNIEQIPLEAGDEKDRLAQRGFKSLLAQPIKSSGNTLGIIGMETTEATRKWNDSQIDFLRIISNIMADAYAKVNQEKEIKYMAYYDYLTKLPNRLLFKDRLDQAILMAQRAGKMIAVIFMDINSFKTVNDTIGHDSGDELLINVSSELLNIIRKSDTVSRFGGDEFLIMLNNIESFKDIITVTDKVMGIFNSPFVINNHEYFIKANAGISVFPADGDNADKLVKNAEIAMYKAKDIGVNQYLLCSNAMKDEAVLKMKLSNSLYRALERDEFYILYQPQVSVDTREIIGMEALLRWRHPELGMISPGMFIPIAEQNGLIVPIGEWVLRTACKQNKAWQDLDLPPVRMAVNVSIYQIKNSDFVKLVRDILCETELDPVYLELEITESVANKEANAILNNLNALKKLGISISIDDFGTEYSSLSRLSMLPIDRVKMDMQFVRNLNKSDKDKAITRGIVYIAHKLGLKLIAEGVETDSQFQLLGQFRCDEVQGYYFYRPLSPEDAEMVVRKNMIAKQERR